jgi:hypothetical protein
MFRKASFGRLFDSGDELGRNIEYRLFGFWSTITLEDPRKVIQTFDATEWKKGEGYLRTGHATTASITEWFSENTWATAKRFEKVPRLRICDCLVTPKMTILPTGNTVRL